MVQSHHLPGVQGRHRPQVLRVRRARTNGSRTRHLRLVPRPFRVSMSAPPVFNPVPHRWSIVKPTTPQRFSSIWAQPPIQMSAELHHHRLFGAHSSNATRCGRTQIMQCTITWAQGPAMVWRPWSPTHLGHSVKLIMARFCFCFAVSCFAARRR